ncbi:MAG: response regulator [Coleofasciculaceae cyanobacterium RL_1_1]|nr:response regulator [Coleofasciculaceae cyanobacterium RL_1_1]
MIAIGNDPDVTASIPGLEDFEAPDNFEDLDALSPINLDDLDELEALDEQDSATEPPPPSPLELDQQRFEVFLDDDRYGTPRHGKIRAFFLQLLHAIAHWHAHETDGLPASFTLDQLVPRVSEAQLSNKKAALKAVKNVRDLGDQFLAAITAAEDSESLRVYRKWTFLSAMVAIAKCQYADLTQYPKSFKDILFVIALRQLAQNIGDRYQTLPAVPARDRQWLETPAVEQLLQPRASISADLNDTELLEAIWGDDDFGDDDPAPHPLYRVASPATASNPMAAEAVQPRDVSESPRVDRGIASLGGERVPLQDIASSRPEARQILPPPQVPLPPIDAPAFSTEPSPEASIATREQTSGATSETSSASPTQIPPTASNTSAEAAPPTSPTPKVVAPHDPAPHLSIASIPPLSPPPQTISSTTLDTVAVSSTDAASATVMASVAATPFRDQMRDQIEPHVSHGEFADTGTSETEAIAPTRKKAAETRQLVSVDLAGIERLNHRLGELLIEQNRLALDEEHLFEATKTMRVQIQQHSKTMVQALEWSEQIMSLMERAGAAYEGKASQGSDLLTMTQLSGVDFDGYADLHLTIKTALQEALELDAKTGEVTRLVRGSGQAMEKQKQLLSVMQDDLVDVRMLPLQEILDRFTLVLRQLSRLQGKTVNLEIRGGELAIEQGVAQRLYDPLLHLVRNAFDHGIEDADTRRSLGKPEVGTIEIRAYNQGTQTTIEVRDDGRGLNVDHIRRKAVEKKFLTQEQADRLISSDRLDILFESGFSTAAKVSEISGRGVGLDVVRTQIQNLKGSISVQSELGGGTIFSLRIPLSLTIAKLLVVQAGGSAYALLLDAIEKIVMPLPGQTRLFENSKVLQIGEGDEKTMVSVRQLADLMHYTSSLVSSTAEPTKGVMSISRDVSAPILLLRHNNKYLGMEVDHIIGEQELVIRPLGAAIAPPNYVYGCSILSDSRLCLVIDGGEMIDRALTPLRSASPSVTTFASYAINAPACDLPAASRTNTLTLNKQPPISSLDPSPPATEQPQPHDNAHLLLIIDDSINLRHTLSLTLQKAGYRVVQARDGVEAIEQLEQTPAIELILCDVEMPRMNGFEFLGTYRQKPELGKVPVITLTSHSSQKYRQIASSLGASAYLTKPYSESELLSTVSGLLAPSTAT